MYLINVLLYPKRDDNMTMSKKFSYWRSDKSWYNYDEETDKFSMAEDAPEKAKESFELWKKKYNE